MSVQIITRNEFLSHIHDTSMVEHRINRITNTINDHIKENAIHKRDRRVWTTVNDTTVNRRAIKQVRKDFGAAGYWIKVVESTNGLNYDPELTIYVAHKLPLNSRFIGWLLGWKNG